MTTEPTAEIVSAVETPAARTPCREHLEQIVRMWQEHKFIRLDNIPEDILVSMIREARISDQNQIENQRADIRALQKENHKQRGELALILKAQAAAEPEQTLSFAGMS